MKVTLASYPTIMMKHGGPMMHLIQIKKHIKKIGIDIELMDIWQSRGKIFNTDLFHLHAANISLWDLAGYLHAHKSKFVVTPIFFTRRSAFTIRTVCNVNTIAKDSCFHFGYYPQKDVEDKNREDDDNKDAYITKHFDFRLDGNINGNESSRSNDFGYAYFRDELKGKVKESGTLLESLSIAEKAIEAGFRKIEKESNDSQRHLA